MFRGLSQKIEELTPQVKEADLQTWSLAEKSTLILIITCVGSDGKSPFLEATRLEALRLLEHVGRSRTLQIVRSLMKGELNATPEIRRQAERMEPILEERVRRTEFETALLRASSRPDDDKNLLRPTVSGGEDLKPSELLRPSNGGMESNEE